MGWSRVAGTGLGLVEGGRDRDAEGGWERRGLGLVEGGWDRRRWILDDCGGSGSEGAGGFGYRWKLVGVRNVF